MKLKNIYMAEAGAGDAGSGGAGDAAAIAAAAAASAASKPWYDGVDSDTLGYMQNRGLDKKTPVEALSAAVKAHRDAEKFVGVPTDQLLRMPKDAADEAGWKALHARLGKPADAKEYDFSAVKNADGTDLDANFTELMRRVSFESNLPKDVAAKITQEITKYQESAKSGQQADMTAKLAVEKDALAKNWGPNFEVNKFVATQGAKQLGMTPEEIGALEGQVGYAKVMEAMRKVGVLFKEDTFVGGQGSTSGGVMTRDQAQARYTELKNDVAFTAKYISGDAEAGRQMKALQLIMANGR